MNTTISHKKLTLYSSVKGEKVGIRHEGVVRIFAFPIKCLLVEDLECSSQLERKTNSLSDSGIFKLGCHRACPGSVVLAIITAAIGFCFRICH